MVSLSILLLAGMPFASARSALVAVAANFAQPAEALVREFEATSEHRVQLSTGSSGALYAQVVNGAPFDLFLSADRDKPEQLERMQLTVAGTRTTYAYGRLVLWSREPGRTLDASTLTGQMATRLAIANPELAPYGEAAVDVMRRMGVYEALQPRLVYGENISQTFQFVASGNAQLGFVARSQVIDPNGEQIGSGWLVPETLHRPITQDRVLLRHGENNPAAIAFHAFLDSGRAQAIITAWGYDVEEEMK